MNNESYESRAMAAYFRASAKCGGAVNQPGESVLTEDLTGKKYVVLANVNGVLAVYRIRNDGMLKVLKRWPAEVTAAFLS